MPATMTYTCPQCKGSVEICWPHAKRFTKAQERDIRASVCGRCEMSNLAKRESLKADREFKKAFTPNRHGEYA